MYPFFSFPFSFSKFLFPFFFKISLSFYCCHFLKKSFLFSCSIRQHRSSYYLNIFLTEESTYSKRLVAGLSLWSLSFLSFLSFFSSFLSLFLSLKFFLSFFSFFTVFFLFSFFLFFPFPSLFLYFPFLLFLFPVCVHSQHFSFFLSFFLLSFFLSFFLLSPGSFLSPFTLHLLLQRKERKQDAFLIDLR